ncbi:MAG TPA: molybdenum cofactor biosynthesis protein MoaB [Methanomicrobia archaeon]|nr:molybdenum cofactor biosynthesis protein MoaB [Methanomicrobia archaeon]
MINEKTVVPSQHKRNLKQQYNCAILTISTSKYGKQAQGEIDPGDRSGAIAQELARQHGHAVVYYAVVPDDERLIGDGIVSALRSDADFIITTGGTGLTTHDITIEVVGHLLEKEIPGFGELFRLKSYEEIGTAAVLSRALAGVIAQKVIFCLPGSPHAVELALREIIMPELAHILKHVRE